MPGQAGTRSRNTHSSSAIAIYPRVLAAGEAGTGRERHVQR
jgi:hypothetical protein